MFNESETFFTCPYCFQQISFLLEELFGRQSYIEDCEVCCNPIKITYLFEDGSLSELSVEKP